MQENKGEATALVRLKKTLKKNKALYQLVLEAIFWYRNICFFVREPKNFILQKTQKTYYFGKKGKQNKPTSWDMRVSQEARIAVQAHVFYEDLIEDVCGYVYNIPYPYDLYITTTSTAKAEYIRNKTRELIPGISPVVDVVENKGRDVLPFLTQMRPFIERYDYFCHIHTKRSLQSDIGDRWRNYLYDNLLGSQEKVKNIIFLFENNLKLGLLYPKNFYAVRRDITWGGNRPYVEQLLKDMKCDIELPLEPEFPAGNMFWGRVSAVKDVFFADIEKKVPPEKGQIDGTIMHAVERVWLYLSRANGYNAMYINTPHDKRGKVAGK